MLCINCQRQRACLAYQLASNDPLIRESLKQLQHCNQRSDTAQKSVVISAVNF